MKKTILLLMVLMWGCDVNKALGRDKEVPDVVIPDALPIVSITSPADSSTVSGIIPVTVIVSDDNGISKLVWLVSGNDPNGGSIVVQSTLLYPPYDISLNTGLRPNGWIFTIRATVYDTANQSAWDQIIVTVEN